MTMEGTLRALTQGQEVWEEEDQDWWLPDTASHGRVQVPELGLLREC